MNIIIYVGMDVHSTSFTLCCYTIENEKILYVQKMGPDYKLILKYLEWVRTQLDGDVQFLCGYEAGCLGYTLYHQLTTKIIVTSRLYEKLPSLNIAEIQDNEDFLKIINTLFHEMGHASDCLSMPKLYKCVEEQTSRKYSIVAMFWLEYLAEKRSCVEGRADHTEFCRDFIGREWRSYKNEDTNWTESNFLYLNKVLAYFMGRTTKPGESSIYE